MRRRREDRVRSQPKSFPELRDFILEGKNATLILLFPPASLPWCPSKVGPLGAGFSVLPPGEGLPRPRGPDGAAGRDAADPAPSHATFRLPGLSGGGGAQS